MAGPGTKTKLNLSRKDWKGMAGAVENKDRPEAVFMTFSTWISPRLSVVKAKNNATDNPEDLATKIMSDFEKDFKSRGRSFKNYFNTRYFDPSSLIFDYTMDSKSAGIGKRTFLEIEINIDTVNDIDYNGKAVPNKNTGRLHNIPFKWFIKHIEESINKILETDIFNTDKSSVEFARSKQG